MRVTGRNYSHIIRIGIVSSVIFLIIMIFSMVSFAKTTPSYVYKSLSVSSGDTLESIAKEYAAPVHMTPRDFIREVSRLNRLSDDKIFAGAYLVIPVNDMNN